MNKDSKNKEPVRIETTSLKTMVLEHNGQTEELEFTCKTALINYIEGYRSLFKLSGVPVIIIDNNRAIRFEINTNNKPKQSTKHKQTNKKPVNVRYRPNKMVTAEKSNKLVRKEKIMQMYKLMDSGRISIGSFAEFIDKNYG